MTTSEPSLAREIYEAAKAQGRGQRRCAGLRRRRRRPKKRGLSIMIGGDKEVVDADPPAVRGAWARRSSIRAAAGAGQHTKMVNQILIATNMIGVCEALLYGYKAGLDLEDRAAIGRAAAPPAPGRSRTSARGSSTGNFDPGFFVEHFIKDMGIALAEAKRMDLSLPGLALAEQLYLAVKAQGHGRKGTHALMLALARLSNVEWK